MEELTRQAGEALTGSALLFVFGAVLMVLATRRMETMKLEVAQRPMKTFALGVVGLLAAIALTIALFVTVIGIPLAIVGVLVAVFAAYSGICAVLTTAGGLIAGHRTNNEYVHLAIGCGVFLILGALPWVGDVVTWVVILLGIGSLVATRAAGLIKPRKRLLGGEPYRDSPA